MLPKVDEAKVQANPGMPKPVDVAGVRRLCGMTQYMSRFLPDLAETLEPMRTLTQNLGHSIRVVYRM